MQQKLVQHVFTTRSWSFWKYHKEGTTKVTPKIKKYVYYIFTENICCACNPMQVVFFLQTCINFVEQNWRDHDRSRFEMLLG